MLNYKPANDINHLRLWSASEIEVRWIDRLGELRPILSYLCLTPSMWKISHIEQFNVKQFLHEHPPLLLFTINTSFSIQTTSTHSCIFILLNIRN
ncbi:hypothetical protein ES702_06893 [subsurface metagenome]